VVATKLRNNKVYMEYKIRNIKFKSYKALASIRLFCEVTRIYLERKFITVIY